MGPKYHVLGAVVIGFVNVLWLTGPSAVACPTGTVTADYGGLVLEQVFIALKAVR